MFGSSEAFEAYVLEKIDKNITIMIDWLDWAGHWQMLIGFDTCGTESIYDDVMILADPYYITDLFGTVNLAGIHIQQSSYI